MGPERRTGRSLRWLLRGTVELPPGVDAVIAGLSLDSRRVGPGELFLACRGRRTAGHRYIDQAVARGAAAVAYEVAAGEEGRLQGPLGGPPLVAVPELSRRAGPLAARFHGEPARALRLVGVTGTNGKTSCAWFLAQALDAAGHRCGVVGTLGSGLPRRLRPGTHTTPDPVSLQAALAGLRAAGATAAALEVSSHALDQGRVEGLPFVGAVFTNLSRDHLDYHGDVEAYGAAKARLFAAPGLRWAVINADDPFGLRLLEALPTGVQALPYGLGRQVGEGLRGRLLASGPEGIRLAVEGPWGRGELRSPLLGAFNAANLLAALGALLLEGVPLEPALARLARLRPAPGRMEAHGGGRLPLAVVDYAHTPDALAQALGALRPLAAGRLWCVFGCGGERDRGKRPLMGEAAARLADRLVLTDDNPRGEDPARIVAEIRAGIPSGASVTVIHDRWAAIAHALRRAAPGDVVLVAGKGHEREQEVAGARRPFSDRHVVEALLRERALQGGAEEEG